MIILSVGMPRAGSGWFYNLTNELMLASGARDAHEIRKRYHLQGILTEVNCNIGALTPRRVLAVMLPALMGNTFVIKAHAAPTPFARQMIRFGIIRPSYIYRDPRDAMLSVMENGRRAIERGRENAFSPYAEFNAALAFIEEYLRIWEAWVSCQQALLVRYEDLLQSYDHEAARLAAFLEIDLHKSEIQAIADRFRPEQARPDQKGLHFSHGKIGRFRNKLTPEQQESMTERFSGFLEKMGYPL